METIKLDEFRRRLKAQGTSDRKHAAFKCPMCKTVQSITSFTRAGTDEETAERYVGFSCVGRVMGAESPREQPDGRPCNWTLGGFLQLHELEVIDNEGKSHPYFEVATPEEAQALEATIAGALSPAVTGQTEIEPDVTAADLGVNAEPDDSDTCPGCGGTGRIGPFFPGGLSTICGNCTNPSPQTNARGCFE